MHRAQKFLITVLLLAGCGLLLALCVGIFSPRWWKLEFLGEVPKDAVNGDLNWQLAQHTTWWGKPLDAKKFWKDRVVWLSVSAKADARRRGRFYPPLPFKDEKLPAYPNDERLYGGGLDDPIKLVLSSTESAFWDNFNKTHPRPPEEIERQQETTVVDYFSNLSPSLKERIRNEPVKMNYPMEAFTADALYWAYIQKCRKYYEKHTFLPSGLAVDSKLITEPLTPEQLQKANAWKLDYLKRLRQEKTDEQYIQAYLKAWNLTEREVFGQGELK